MPMGDSITEQNVLEKLSVACSVMLDQRAPVELIKAHPFHVKFPGSVAPHESRIACKIQVDSKRQHWHSTGLYAAAGDVITVHCPPHTKEQNITIRIGCHSDQLYQKKEWKRAPDICREFIIDSELVRIASSFGGLIYVDVKEEMDIGVLDFIIENAVLAPRFILDETDINDWQNIIRNYPAPWAEFQSKYVIHSVPSSYARTVIDPRPALQTWDQGVSYCADLASNSQYTHSHARYVTDVQISLGYMHSGYPIMTLLDQAEDDQLLNANNVKTNWGLWHELGHNFQNDWWTFSGSEEVTVNIFTVYVHYKFNNDTWDALKHRFANNNQMPQLMRNFMNKPSFELWKSDPFIGLIMYIQMIEAFGFESFKRVFRQYLTFEDHPEDDKQKRDKWLVMYSRTVKRDMSAFFDMWKIPVSNQAKREVSKLPKWIPGKSNLL
jgi:hypothetical protein